MDATLLGKKALLTSTLTLYFQLFYYFLKMYRRKCIYDAILYLKGERKSLAKGGFEFGLIASKNTRLTIYTTETNMKQASFFSVDNPNHTLEAELV